MRLGLPGRRRAALAGLAVVVALAAAGAAVIVLGSGEGDPGERPLSARERAQLEAAAPGAAAQGRKASLPVPPRVRRVAAALPLPRAVAQLFLMGAEAGAGARASARGWGGLVLPAGGALAPAHAAAVSRAAVAAARRGRHPEPFVVADQPGGPRSTFPAFPPRPQPLVGSPAVARADARAGARALRAVGVRMTLAPVADVGAAAGPLQERVFSDDPAVVARLAAAAVEGWRSGGVVPAVGHFPGQGAASEDPDAANATVGLSPSELRARDLPPFAAVARRAPAIVLSNAVYAAWDGVTPATVLPEAVRVLRRDLRYRGVVVSADLAATAPVLGTGVGAAAVQALEAGADLFHVSGDAARQEAAYGAVLRAVRSGRISRARLRLSVQRVLALKRAAGLMPDRRPARRRTGSR